VTSYNYAWLSQHDCWGTENLINLEQDAYTYNYASVEQDGIYNQLIGAYSDGSIKYTAPAVQNSSSDYNYLWSYQVGNSNEIGLYQSASGSNSATITQLNGGNSLAVYQISTGGSNTLIANQNGNATATVIQTGSGNNIGTVTQGP